MSRAVTHSLLLVASLMLATAPAAPAATGGLRIVSPGVRPLAEVELRVVTPPDVAKLLAEDAAAAGVGGLPARYAKRLPLALDFRHAGTHERRRDGSRMWRLRVRAPGAGTLSAAFSRFDLAPGAALTVHGRTPGEVRGPYRRADRGRRGRLWTAAVEGDEMTLELWLPSRAAWRATRLELASVSYGYRDLGGVKQGSCNNDVVCPAGAAWTDEARAVARYTLEGEFFCTATLLNDTARDFRPLLLTADHCGVTAANDDSVVVYWNYQSPTCGELGGGSLAQAQSGATLLSRWDGSDFALLELAAPPDPAYRVYHAGWDASATRPAGGVVIHHPNGEEKAISFDDDPLEDSDSEDGSPGRGTHWRVAGYESGTTELGSSGACLFDSASGRCVGALTAGDSSCSNPGGHDVFGKLALSWEGGGAPSSRLRDWLDPAATGTLALDGADPFADTSPCVADGQTLCLLGGRFAATATWRNQYDGSSGVGGAVPYTDFSGFFWFSDAANLELMMKVLDLGGTIKVFYGQLTDLGFTLRLREVATGRVKEYRNSDGNCGDIDQNYAVAQTLSTAPAGSAKAGDCVAGPHSLCLLGGRFRIEVKWENHFSGATGSGFAQPLSPLSGLFHYGDARNVELLVKVLDFGDRVLFLWGALSDFRYDITVTDTTTEAIHTYANPGGSYCGGIDSDLGPGGGGGDPGTTVDEREPNDRVSQAQALAGAPVTVNAAAEVTDFGELEIVALADDVEDLYRVTTTGPGLEIELSGLVADLDLYLINGAVTEVLAESAEPGTANERIALPELPAGTYYLGVSIYDRDPGQSTSPYVLRVDGAL